MISRSKKEDILAKLEELIKNSKSSGFVQSSGVTVAEISKLKRNLREVGGTYILAKKTIIKLAYKNALGVEINDDLLPGQIGVIFSSEDAIAGLGKMNASMKEILVKKEQKMNWTGGVFEGNVQNAEEISVIASMPSRETLLGRLVGSMQSPIAGLARFFDAAAKKLTEEGKEKLGN